jgi:hypothetical protein
LILHYTLFTPQPEKNARADDAEIIGNGIMKYSPILGAFEADFHYRLGQTDGAGRQAPSALFAWLRHVRRRTFCRWLLRCPRHQLALRPLATDLASQTFSGQMFFILRKRRAVSTHTSLPVLCLPIGSDKPRPVKSI